MMTAWQWAAFGLLALGALSALGVMVAALLRALRERALVSTREESEDQFRERVVREFAYEPSTGNLGSLERKLHEFAAAHFPLNVEVQFVTERLPLAPGHIRIVLQVPR